MNIREFKSALKPYRALIGFDYGAKRLGVAVSDLLLTVATSHKIIQRGSWEKIWPKSAKSCRKRKSAAWSSACPCK